MGCIGLFDPQELCELRNALEEVSMKNEASCGQQGPGVYVPANVPVALNVTSCGINDCWATATADERGTKNSCRCCDRPIS